jgi:hypothetical protein
MRFIQGLTPETLSLLTRIHKQSQYPHVRQRAHCMMLSFRGYPIQLSLSRFVRFVYDAPVTTPYCNRRQVSWRVSDSPMCSLARLNCSI